MQSIQIQGAKTHNLKNIDLILPRDKLIVITGLSGSGKSSLAFDTLYAEGQRRYVESLSAYARQFLSMMEKPDVEHIEGLSPAISIQQKSTSHNPRSTVGTITEIHDYLRLLYARVGQPQCPKHHLTLEAQTISQMVDQVLALPEGTKIMLLAPVVKARKGEHLKLLESLKTQGFIRARINGEIVELEDTPPLDLRKKHTIEVVIDRLNIKPDIQTRLADSFETTLHLAKGIASVVILSEKKKTETLHFSAQYACSACGYSLTELEPRLFSFNNPTGACPECDGLGHKQYMDPNKLIFNKTLSLANGAIQNWDRHNFYYFSLLQSLATHYRFKIDTPFCKLPQKIQKIILYGNEGEIIKFTYHNDKKQKQTTRLHAFEGILPNIERRYLETDSQYVREELSKFLTLKKCPECKGARLNEPARHVFIANKNLPEIANWSIESCLAFFKQLKLSGWRQEVANKILKEIIARLQFLSNVGLDYLSLSRSAETLSGGEAQRIRLASQIGAGLVGVMYVLDEPSIGLHQRDNERLIETLNHLRNLGNTVIVVEHDEDTIQAADYIVDIGPGAGLHGGEVVAAGNLQEIKKAKRSLTGAYLSGKECIPVPDNRVKPNQKAIVLSGASGNNLKQITATFPIGLMICVTGVSGSGKSTLVNDTLYPIAAQQINHNQSLVPLSFQKISGLDHIDKIVDIDQSPIGRTPRSNAATYTGIFTDIRDLFSNTPEARARGYKPGRFSFNVKGGRCEACQGDGLIKVEMHFLPDLYVPCDICQGKRYNRETLEIYYKGKNIDDILNMTVEAALVFFNAIAPIARKLQTLIDVGMGYIELGQSATTLSGGEAQRVKLSKELSKRDTGNTLYVLDEPTTGLHFHDVKHLLAVLTRLRDQGNTVVIIEHNLDVIKTADWIIDLGPEGGDKGGEIIASGTPEAITKVKKSHTGVFLKKVLKQAKCLD